MARIDITYYHSDVQEQMDLKLLFFGKEECLPGHFWGPGVRDAYIIHFVHSGRGLFSIADKTYGVRAGEGFLIPPGTIVHYQASDTDPWTYSWFGFRGLQAKTYLERAWLTPLTPVFTPLAGRGFESFYDELLSVRTERGGDALSLGILYRLMAGLIACSPTGADEERTVDAKELYVRQAIEIIKSSYSQKISMLEIARSVGLDRTYLSSLFKARFGVSLQGFLLEYRMRRAAELLRRPELSVSDISRSVGYNDPFLFSKMFKKVNGCSPKHFREGMERRGGHSQ